MYAQIIDDTVGNTLVAASTAEKAVKAELAKTNKRRGCRLCWYCNRKESIREGYQNSCL